MRIDSHLRERNGGRRPRIPADENLNAPVGHLAANVTLAGYLLKLKVEVP
jgi:hypothetical protein